MDDFQRTFYQHFDELKYTLSTDNGEWVIKGFIDIYKNIYTISTDTKVLSKVIELMLFPVVSKFANEHNYKIYLSDEQNQYPDITIETPDKELIAIDLKSTYRTNHSTVNGMTLGAFTGYFRRRTSNKNIKFPYERYSAHYVLGVIYSRNDGDFNEMQKFKYEDLNYITSVVKDFQFFLQEKWKIAIDRPGSGNTKNIGSETEINKLITGTGFFSNYGKEVFDDYWMNYLTKDMALKIEVQVPYHNFKEYKIIKRLV